MTELLGIAPVIRLAKLYYFRWALAEINPLHPDVPRIVHAINELSAPIRKEQR